MTTKKTAFWNGKNLANESHVGANSLISEGPKTNTTQAKYQVSNETLSAADLQPSAQSAAENTKTGG